MERHKFREENPELVEQQEREGNKGIRRILAITILSISSVLATKYVTNSDFQGSVDTLLQKASILKK